MKFSFPQIDVRTLCFYGKLCFVGLASKPYFCVRRNQMDIILKAIVTGFILSIMIGPVFFVILETSIKKGVRAAMMFDIGVILSDIIYISIAYLFYAEVEKLTEGSNSEWLKVVGGSVFIVYGFYTYFKKMEDIVVNELGKIVTNRGDYRNLMLKGFVLNFANPMVIFYWFTVMTLAEKNTSDKATPVFFFISILLSTFIIFDILKMVGAKKLRPLMTPKILKALNQLIGIVFVGFGLFLLLKGIIAL